MAVSVCQKYGLMSAICRAQYPHRRAEHVRVEFIIDGNLLAPFRSAIIVVRRRFF